MAKPRRASGSGGSVRPAALGTLLALVLVVLWQQQQEERWLPDVTGFLTSYSSSSSQPPDNAAAPSLPAPSPGTVGAESQSRGRVRKGGEERRGSGPSLPPPLQLETSLPSAHSPASAAAIAAGSQGSWAPPAGTTAEQQQLLKVVQKRAGLYLDKSVHREFSDIVLITAANYAYFSVYRNWHCHAEKHGLDWAVIAHDEEAVAKLESDRALPTLGEQVSGMNGWGSAKLDMVGRNKMFMVFTIMKIAGLGVIFSDADNMFRSDPFAPGVHLGDLIRSGKYDYVYQEELAKAPAKGHIVPGDGGNTGFFYATPKRKAKMVSLFSDVVKEVDRQREEAFKKHGEKMGADQPIFWQLMQKLRSTGGKSGPGEFKCVRLCKHNPTCKASTEDTMDYCSMDAFMHPTGWDDPPETLVTYHANYAANEAKVEKLKKAGLWGAWNEKTNRCASRPAVSPGDSLMAGLTNGGEAQQHIIRTVKKRAGLYADKAAHPEFSDVVLITAANFAYFSVYQNWRCNAEKHGLDWVVVAHDEKAVANLDSDRALPTLGDKVSGMNGWGSAKLDTVGRNKMFMVLTVMKLTGLGVLFTDADNMFRSDPFAPGVHLGDLIRSGKYDYVYQEELAKAPAKDHVVPGDGGNTGFFYATPKRKPKVIQLFGAVVEEVDRQREDAFRRYGERLGADQPIFWQVMQKLRSTGGSPGPGGFKCVKLCKQNPTCKAETEDTLDYCSMDAFMHPTGWDEPPKQLVSYHANYAANEDKIAKLKKAGVWNAWDETKGACSAAAQPYVASASSQDSASPTGTTLSDEQRRILEVVKKRAGLYVDKSAHPEFADVVLITAANYGYFSVYQNWRCNAEKHGLDWAVVAHDEKAVANLEADRALPTLGDKVSGMHGWGSAKLDTVGRNKMTMVLTVMKISGLGVLFSDADNMFRTDPFAPGVHLGDLIRSDKYDYVYQEELQKAPSKNHVVPGDGGNTGFFYATPKRNAKVVSLFADVVTEVDRQREESFKKNGERLGADQPIFWQVMGKLRSTGGRKGPGGFKCVKLCKQNPTCKASAEDTLDYCSMDAFMHPTGWEKPPKELVSYHANYAANEAKIAKLEKAGLWGAYLEKKGRCAVQAASAAPAGPALVTAPSSLAEGGAPDSSLAVNCLKLSTPSLDGLSYPPDAETHFEEVWQALSPWFDFAEKQFMKAMKNPYHCGEGYCGPWIENKWIAHYYTKLWKGRQAGTRLSDIFGPYIPIFMTYVDLWIANVFEYENMIAAMKKVLRPSVAYITLLQHDTGLPSSRDKLVNIMKELPNVLVLSAGGYGNVPIPLFKQPEALLSKKFWKPMKDRKFLTSYMGSEGNAPKDMRKKMIKEVKKAANAQQVKVHTGFGSPDEWHAVAGNSKASLCPRGYGRTAFHLFEILQLGLIPIHVFLDIPWLPYRDLFPSLGFSTDVKGLPALMAQLQGMEASQLELMEEKIKSLRESHFTDAGVLQQISLFMLGGHGDLRCQARPESLNG
eukprot:TRINITY_DN73316_c0_g1_i1.p1 TRINITY_DN73316_c0_g1~~TRINITY_DN73316_c0_g1_i1.p1  ORF type:complete len:1494 (-),score=273.54 TRINITY_DN73316_c0_g1_i1:60-4541(-)